MSLHVVPVRLHFAGLSAVAQIDVEDLPKTLAKDTILNRRGGFYATR
jgi:hypothetical protein